MSSKNIPSLSHSLEKNREAGNSPPLLSQISSACSRLSKIFFTSFNSFTSSIKEEGRKFSRIFEKNPYLQIFKNIYSQTPPKEEVVEPKGMKILQELFQKEGKTLVTDQEIGVDYDKQDSLLMSPTNQSAGGIALSTFTSLFKENYSSASSYKELMHYISNYFILFKSDQASTIPFAALTEAFDEQEEVQKIISSKNKEDLEKKAEQLAKSVQTLSVEKPLIYVGAISKGGGFSSPILNTLIKQIVPEKYQSHFKDLNQSSDSLKSFVEQMNKLLEEKCKEIGTTKKDLEDMYSNGLGFFFSESFVAAIQKSLKEDFKEIAFGTSSPETGKKLAEELWDRMNEEGFSSFLTDSVEKICKQGMGIVQNGAKDIKESVTASFPKYAKELLNLLGLEVGDKSISIEIEKQNNGKYRLIIFSEGTPHHPEGVGGVQIPLVYSNLDGEKLDSDFFFRLLSYQAWPKWYPWVSYSLDDFFEGLIGTLGQMPDQVEAHTFVPDPSSESDTDAKRSELFLRYHLKLNEDEFQKTQYELRLHAFLDLWSQGNLQVAGVIPALQLSLDRITKESIELYQKNLLSLTHLKQIYATNREFQEKTKKEVGKVGSLPKTVLPPILQESLKNILESGWIYADSIEYLQEAFVDIFGKEIEEPLQFAIQELLSTLPKKPPSTSLDGKLFSFVPTKISLLTIYRTFAHLSSLLYKCTEVTIAAKLLEGLLIKYVPMEALSRGTTPLIALLLYYFGPTALQTIFPERLFKHISSVYALYSEIITHVKSRITSLMIKGMIHFLLGQDQIAHINFLIRDIQQKTTRDGEIFYDLPSSKGKNTRYHLLKKEEPPIPKKERIAQKPIQESPRPKSEVITAENLLSHLRRWEKEGNNLSDIESKYYLNLQLRNLPIPCPGHPSIWDEVKDIPSTLESLHSLFLLLAKNLKPQSEEFSETIVSLFALYSIFDYLARRSPDTQLTDEFKPNGCDLMIWMGDPSIKLINPRTYKQLESVCTYFDIDVKKRYSIDEINERRSKCLFSLLKKRFHHYTDENTIEFINLGWETGDKNYYIKLREDPVIQKKLESYLGKKSNRYEKLITLFCDPPLPPSPGPIGTRPKDLRNGILPRPFYILRFAYALLSEKINHRDIVRDPTEFSLTRNKEKTLIDFSFLHGDLTFTVSSDEAKTNIAGFTPIKDELILKNEYWKNRDPLLYREKAFYYFTLFAGSRTQGEIMQGQNGTSQAQKILEMIMSYKADQVMRAIGYFSNNLPKLSDTRFIILFDLFINNLGALQSQLEERPEITKALGTFFKKGMNYLYKKRNFDCCLYLIRVGSIVLRYCKVANKDAALHFPDFSSFLQEELIPTLQKEKSTPYSRLLCSYPLFSAMQLQVTFYADVDPNKTEESLAEKAIIDICRFDYTMISNALYKESPLFSDNKKISWLWRPYIIKALETNPSLRRKVMETIITDSGIPLPKGYNGIWKGSFPRFETEGLHIDLEKSDGVVENKQNASSYLRRVIGDPGPCTILSETLMRFPDHDLLVVLDESTHQVVKVTRNINGALYRLVPIAEAKEKTIWIEEKKDAPNCIALLMKGYEVESVHLAKYFTDKGGEGIELLEDLSLTKNLDHKIDLTKTDHGLSLLSWFQPLEKIEAYSHLSQLDKLSRLEFPHIHNGSDHREQLIFEIKKGEAVSEGAFPGYSIAKKQKDPSLSNYANYLLLENKKGEKKILLVVEPIQSLLSSFMIHHFGNLTSSPLCDSLMKTIFEGNQKEKSEYFVYSVNDEGKLETSDPIALTYLFLYHFVRGNSALWKELLVKLESFGKRHPFPQKAISLIEALYPPLFLIQNEVMTEISLRLASILHENALFQPTSEREKPALFIDANGSIPSHIIEYFLIQTKYAAYLNDLKKGGSPFLSEYQELFLLKKLEDQNHEYLEKGLDWLGIAGELVKWTGLDSTLKKYLPLMPIIVERSNYLAQKKDPWKADENVVSEKSEPSVPQTGNTCTKIVHTFGKFVKGFYDKKSDLLGSLSLFLSMLNSNLPFESLPYKLSDLTPENIIVYFPYYYRLATKELPADFKGNIAMETLFEKQCTTFRKNLPLLKGSYNGISKVLNPILQTVSNYPFFFPKVEELEELINKGDLQELDAFFKSILTRCKIADSREIVNATYQVGKKVSSLFLSTIGAIPETLAYKTFQFIGLFQTVTDITSEQSLEVKPKIPLFTPIAKVLECKEKKIDLIMDQLFEEYFEEDKKATRGKESEKKVAPFIATEKEESMKEAFEKLNQTVKDYYDRPQVEKKEV